MKVSIEEARSAKDLAKDLLREFDSVVGIGLTSTQEGYAIKVNLRNESERDRLPQSVAGVPVNVEVVGNIVKRSA
jgi:peptide deformylase